MARSRLGRFPCSIASAADAVGERWALMIIREVAYGARRFDLMQQRLGISRSVLADRLDTLVEHGLLTRHEYQQHPPRHEYRLTPAGNDFLPILLAIMQWGDRWYADDQGAPVELYDDDTGERVVPTVVDETTGEPVRFRTLRMSAGPGMPDEHRGTFNPRDR